VLEVIRRSAEFLQKKGVDSARLQAELLLAEVLKLPRMQLYLNFERALIAAEEDTFREFVRRRGQREPLQQIIGSTSFCGLEIAVNRHVLVPRPETELLAENAWKFLIEASARDSRPVLALDYGTGSGCLAVALAVKCEACRVTALDVSPDALDLARQNAAGNGVAERISFIQANTLEMLPDKFQFDLLVSNPPYIPTAEIATLQPEVRDYEPRQALDGGTDGLDFYRRFATGAAALLRAGGKIMLEIGDSQASALRNLFEQQNWIVERVIDDYNQRPRVLIAAHG
jgi:release factor glutamine methyltransferase